MYLSYVLTGKSLPEIGRIFDGMDHTTVLNAVVKIGALREQDRDFDAKIQSYIDALLRLHPDEAELQEAELGMDGSS